MLRDYFKSIQKITSTFLEYLKKYNWWMFILLPAWVLVGFFIAQAIMVLIIWLLAWMGISLDSFNQTVINAVVAAIVYLITLGIVIFIPWFVRKHHIDKETIGLVRLLSWGDIALAPAALVIYFIISSILILIASKIFPWFNVNQVQDTGFSHLNQQYEYILAFVTLVVVAPAAEELLFRGYLYGRLKKFVPIWAAIIATSLLFGFVHGAWNLAIDTFALSIILCLLRESTGNIWASILVHMAKNGIAFYILFISPLVLTTLGK